MSIMETKEIKEQMPKLFDELYSNMKNYMCATGKEVGYIRMPDGRLAEVYISINTDTEEWRNEEFATDVEDGNIY